VHKHITDVNIPWALIATKWFVCLFAEVLPVEVNKNSSFLFFFFLRTFPLKSEEKISLAENSLCPVRLIFDVVFQTVLRIWDCLFYEGSKIMFRVCLTLVALHKDELLACEDFASLANCFKTITKDPSAMYCHSFMTVTIFFLLSFD